MRDPDTWSPEQRADEPIHAPSVRFGPFIYHRTGHTIWRAGNELVLPQRSLLVLDILLRSPGKTISREHLIDEIWQGGFVTDTSLTEAVSRLRQALGDEARHPRYIQTMHGRGYKFIAPLEEVVEDSVTSVAKAATTTPGLTMTELATDVLPRAKGPGRQRSGAGATPSRMWKAATLAASLLFAIAAWWVTPTITPPARDADSGKTADGAEQAGHTDAANNTESADGSGRGDRPLYRLAEVALDGKPPTRYGFPALPLDDLSVDPVGGRLAFSMRSGTGSDVWMLHPERGLLQRVASGGHFSDPVWTRDGRGLAVAHNRHHSIDLMYGEPESGHRLKVLLDAPFDQFPESWSADGRSLIYSERHPETGFDLWILRQADEGRWLPTPLVRTKKHEAFGAISPDGRYVAYVSKERTGSEAGPVSEQGTDAEEADTTHVFVLDLDQPTTQPVKVSQQGGRFPFWSADGDRLHYVEGDDLWTLDVAHLADHEPVSKRRATPVDGVRLAAPSSTPGRFVVAVLDHAG